MGLRRKYHNQLKSHNKGVVARNRVRAIVTRVALVFFAVNGVAFFFLQKALMEAFLLFSCFILILSMIAIKILYGSESKQKLSANKENKRRSEQMKRADLKIKDRC